MKCSRTTAASPSVAEIIESVPRPTGLAMIERTLSDLRAERDSLINQANAAEQATTSQNATEMRRLLRENAARRRELDTAIAAEQKRHDAVRSNYAAAVQRALAPRIAERTNSARAAYADFVSAWSDLDGIAIALRRAGGVPRVHATSVQFAALNTKLIAGVLGDARTLAAAD